MCIRDRFTTLEIERAEPKERSRLRPDRPTCYCEGNVIACWPIKLTLVPLLMEEVLGKIMSIPSGMASSDTTKLRKAQVGNYPWNGSL